MTVASGSRTQIEPYFKAWNARDPEAVAAASAEGGTYTDPVAARPLPFVQRRHKQGTS